MNMRIIADSSLDMSEELKKTLEVDLIPFRLYLDGVEYVDDLDIDVPAFFKAMKASAKASSACPSPNEFIENFKKAGEVFVVTISDKLSGTYNSATLAKKMYEEEYGDKKIHIFNTKAAAAAETLIAIKIANMIEKNHTFNEIVENIELQIKQMTTYFISDSLENLMKNGRISRFKGTLATLMHIKPIMGADQGEIVLFEKIRGSNKAFRRLVEKILEKDEDFSDRIMTIAHAENIERAESLKEELLARGKFKEIIIVPTAVIIGDEIKKIYGEVKKKKNNKVE
jgi:DegV family protein with EDD domain